MRTKRNVYNYLVHVYRESLLSQNQSEFKLSVVNRLQVLNCRSVSHCLISGTPYFINLFLLVLDYYLNQVEASRHFNKNNIARLIDFALFG
jgi:hypothetical protein